MKKINRQALLDQLQADTRQIILTTHQLLQQDPEVLLQPPSPGKWSIAQVIEHLNTYGRYYLPLLEKALKNAPPVSGTEYTPGWLGDYFTKMMLPDKNGQVRNKMRAFKNHSPLPDIDSKTVLDEFLQQENQLLQLLEKARHAEIGKRNIPVSIAKFIKLKTGDTFRFLIAHHQRHFVQAANTLKIVKAEKEKLKAFDS